MTTILRGEQNFTPDGSTVDWQVNYPAGVNFPDVDYSVTWDIEQENGIDTFGDPGPTVMGRQSNGFVIHMTNALPAGGGPFTVVWILVQ